MIAPSPSTVTTLEGRVAVVTGAAGGLGGAIADRLVRAGATVCVTDRSQQCLDEIVHARGWTDRVECYPADLFEQGAVARLCEQIRQRHASLHVLVHSAGIIGLGRVAESSLEDFDRQYHINVRTPYEITQHLLAHMTHCHGQIVFLNSSAGLNARQGVSQYAASKHAFRAIADSLRAEVNPQGVRVLSMFLGRTASRMQAEVHAHEARTYRPELLLQPDDVASIVVSALQLPGTAEVTDIHIRPMLKSY